MKGAIFFTGKFGSTKQYAQWISEATGFPVFDLNKEIPDSTDYDLLILGSSVFIGKLTISKWAKSNWKIIKDKSIILYSVSGTEPGHPDLKKYITDSLPKEIIQRIKYVPLRGRLIMDKLPWWTRLILRIGSLGEKDPDTQKRMTQGFDFMEKSNIEPIIKWVRSKQKSVLV